MTFLKNINYKDFSPSVLIINKNEININPINATSFHFFAIKKYIDCCILTMLDQNKSYSIELHFDHISLQEYRVLQHHLKVSYLLNLNIKFNVIYIVNKANINIRIADLIVQSIHQHLNHINDNSEVIDLIDIYSFKNKSFLINSYFIKVHN